MPAEEHESAGKDVLRFGRFELDRQSGVLLKEGAPAKLRHQSFEVLALLASHPGQLLSRDTIQARLWTGESLVNFDQGLNSCIREVRATLGDHPDSPVYIQTLARRGYRFIAPVEQIEASLEARGGASLRRPLAAGFVAILAAALLWLSVSSPEPAEKGGADGQRVMIAVLPFDNLSGDAAEDYFSRGLTEEMITLLGHLHPVGLGVIGRIPTSEYRNRSDGIGAIQDDLGVDYVLEGSVRRSAKRVRITARLLRAEDGEQTWAETYEGELGDVLTVQQRAAEAVVASLRYVLPRPARARPSKAVDPEAHAAYLKGRYFWNLRGSASLRKSLELFQRAIARQPDYAMAHVGEADAHIVLGLYAAVPARLAAASAKAAATRALDLDDGLAEAHSSMGAILGLYEKDWSASESEFRRSIELNPSYATARQWFSLVLRCQRRLDESLEQAQTAATLAPLSLVVRTNLAMTFLYRGEIDAAEAHFRSALEMNPSFAPAAAGIGRVRLARGDAQQAIASFEEALAFAPGRGRMHAWLAYSYARAGRRADAEAVLRNLEQSPQGQAFGIAAVHAGLGRQTEALDWLERAHRDGEPHVRNLLLDERLVTLREHPRLRSLALHAGLPIAPPIAVEARDRSVSTGVRQ